MSITLKAKFCFNCKSTTVLKKNHSLTNVYHKETVHYFKCQHFPFHVNRKFNDAHRLHRCVIIKHICFAYVGPLPIIVIVFVPTK